MRRFGAAMVMVSVLAAAGCATMTAGSYVVREADFTQYRTWDWGVPDSLPVGDPRLDNNPFFQDHIQGAVERRLAGKGYARADTPETADLLVHFHASVNQRFEVDNNQALVNCSEQGCEPRVFTFDAGTFVVDVMDRRTGRMLWRGWAQEHMGGVIGDQDVLEATVEQAVTRMMAELPPRLP